MTVLFTVIGFVTVGFLACLGLVVIVEALNNSTLGGKQ